MTRAVGVSLGHRQLSEADHWILSLASPPALACTHLVKQPYPHVAISLVTTAAYDTAPDLRAAAAGDRLVPFERRDPTPCCAAR